MAEAKATARHEKIAKSKKDRLNSLEKKLSAEKMSLSKLKTDLRARIRKLPKDERSEARAKADLEISDARRRIASVREEIDILGDEMRNG